MASGISLSGFSSGIDTKTIVAQLMAVERRPVDRLTAKNKQRQQVLTVFSDLRSKLSAFKTAVDALNTVSDFNKFTATTSDTDDKHFTVSVDSEAQPTTHTIKVQSLALAEKDVSQGFSAISSTIGTGVFKITIGSTTTEITINESNNTLDGLRNAINSSAAKATANIMNDGSGSSPYRLMITSDETGTANAMTIDTSGMSGGTIPVFTKGEDDAPGQQATNAQLVFDGTNVTSASNEITDIVNGVNLKLKNADTTTTYSINIESNLEDVKDGIGGVVDKYNELITYLKAKETDKTLGGDTTFTTIKRKLQDIVFSRVSTGGAYGALSQVGVTSTSGALSVDEDKLTDALEADFDSVMRLFTAYGSTSNANIEYVNSTSGTAAGTYNVVITGVGASFGGTIGGYAANAVGSNLLVGADGTPVEGLSVLFNGTIAGAYGTVTFSSGVLDQFYRTVDEFLNSTDGLIKNKESSLNRQIRNTQSDIDKKELALSKVEQRLNLQFTQMESMLSRLQTQSSVLTAMINSAS